MIKEVFTVTAIEPEGEGDWPEYNDVVLDGYGNISIDQNKLYGVVVGDKVQITSKYGVFPGSMDDFTAKLLKK